MKIFGLEKLSMVDYEGHLCAVVFTAGCNFCCPYCHNADLVKGNHLSEIYQDDFFAYLDKRKSMLDSVCISGGEPTLQPDLPDFIKKIKDKGFLVKVDTNGTNFEMLKNLVEQELVDYVAMDIKNSPSAYQKTAGREIDIASIKKSVEFLKQNLVPYEFRTTLVDNYHNEKTISEMTEWLKGAKKLYLQHFVDNGTCITNGLKEVDRATAIKFKNIVENTVSEVQLRGY